MNTPGLPVAPETARWVRGKTWKRDHVPGRPCPHPVLAQHFTPRAVALVGRARASLVFFFVSTFSFFLFCIFKTFFPFFLIQFFFSFKNLSFLALSKHKQMVQETFPSLSCLNFRVLSVYTIMGTATKSQNLKKKKKSVEKNFACGGLTFYQLLF